MQTEFRHCSGFNDWYTQKQRVMEIDELMGLLKDKRNISVHQKPVAPRALVKAILHEQIVVSEALSITIKHVDGTEEKRESPPEVSGTKSNAPPATVEWLWYFDELPDKDIASLGAEHLKKLESLVNECESRFQR
jgi:hypothetical protein